MGDNIHYNTGMMHSTAKTIQTNGQELQGFFQNVWSSYQTDMQGAGAFPAFTSYLTGFMDLCKTPSLNLANNRMNLGTELDKAATAAEQLETKMKAGFNGPYLLPGKPAF